HSGKAATNRFCPRSAQAATTKGALARKLRHRTRLRDAGSPVRFTIAKPNARARTPPRKDKAAIQHGKITVQTPYIVPRPMIQIHRVSRFAERIPVAGSGLIRGS